MTQPRKNRPGRSTSVDKRGSKCKGGVVITRMDKKLHIKLVEHCKLREMKINDLILALIYREVIDNHNLVSEETLIKSFSFRKSNAKTS
jgi:hypothetical protein